MKNEKQQLSHTLFKPSLFALYLASSFIVLVFNCENSMVEKPQAASIAFNHKSMTEECMGCHEKDRPLESEGKIHGGGADCYTCHVYDKKLKWNKQINFDHSLYTADCDGCHEKDRPARDDHPNVGDCVQCHAYPSWAAGENFVHSLELQSCQNCHNKDRPQSGAESYPNVGKPTNFDENDPKAPGSSHYLGKDCISCHLIPDQSKTAFEFSHSEPKLEFCLPCHFSAGNTKHFSDSQANPDSYKLEDFGNCSNCHKNSDAKADRNWNL